MRALLLTAVLLLPGPALAAPPPRTAQARQAAVDLAYAIGAIHALRQACLGEADQGWRTHMARLMETEEMDPALGEAGRRRLADSFNAGFNAKRAQFPRCRTEVQADLVAVAAKAEVLARRLAGPAGAP